MPLASGSTSDLLVRLNGRGWTEPNQLDLLPAVLASPGADSLVAKMAEAIWTAEDSAVNLTIAALIAAKLTAPGMDDVVVFRNVVRNLQCAYEAVAAAGKAVEDNPLARKSQAQR